LLRELLIHKEICNENVIFVLIFKKDNIINNFKGYKIQLKPSPLNNGIATK